MNLSYSTRLYIQSYTAFDIFWLVQELRVCLCPVLSGGDTIGLKSQDLRISESHGI